MYFYTKQEAVHEKSKKQRMRGRSSEEQRMRGRPSEEQWWLKEVLVHIVITKVLNGSQAITNIPIFSSQLPKNETFRS